MGVTELAEEAVAGEDVETVAVGFGGQAFEVFEVVVVEASAAEVQLLVHDLAVGLGGEGGGGRG